MKSAGVDTGSIGTFRDLLNDDLDFRAEWIGHFCIGGVTIRVESELPVPMETIGKPLRTFEVQDSGEDVVVIRHVFRMPKVDRHSLGDLVYKGSPWEVWKAPQGWTYLIVPSAPGAEPYQMGVFSEDHGRGVIFHPPRAVFSPGGVHSLTLFSTDQILLAPLFADRQGVLLHSSGAILGGKGVLFLGPSGAGKSTTLKLIRERATILCDDRNIVRKTENGYQLHGTWSHGEIDEVSSISAELAAILVLRQSPRNRLSPPLDARTAFAALIGRVIRGAETKLWWEKTVAILADLARSVPVIEMEFDRSGLILAEIEQFLAVSQGVQEDP